jgi:3-oxoacyl-[acyl-carrier-protein] synthase II
MPTADRAVLVTGLGIDMPLVRSLDALLEPASAPITRRPSAAKETAASGADRYKDRATRMALAAAMTALNSAGLRTVAAEQLRPDRFGVVVSSNLGNLDTVCRVVETIASSSTRHLRPMDLPNASSNVIASTLAIRYGCKAANVMLCNGAHSGIDALHLARNVIRADRADRMLVVGVEPLNDVVASLMRQSSSAGSVAGGDAVLGEGAAAVIVESVAAATARHAPVLGRVDGYGYDAGSDLSRSAVAALYPNVVDVDLWLTPALAYRNIAANVERALQAWKARRPPVMDLTARVGELYGALGVLQCIVACRWLGAHGGHTAVMTAGACWGDGSSSLVVTACPQPNAPNVREGAATTRRR